MLRTKEDINLRYLEDKKKLELDLIYRRVEANPETKAAILELGDPALAYAYGVFLLGVDDPDIREVIVNAKSRYGEGPSIYVFGEVKTDSWLWWYNQAVPITTSNGNSATPGNLMKDSAYWAWRRGLEK